MALLETEFARRDLQGVELRSSPARLAWRLDGLNSSDNHELRVRFVASAQVPEDATDRRVFAEVILNRPGPVTIEQLCEHFRASLISAARDATCEHKAEEWLDPAGERSLCDLLQKAAQQVGFSCGLQILPPFVCEVRSSTFERSQRAQQQVSAQQQTLARATQLLQQFNDLRQASPNRSAGELLSHLSAADQSEMLTALFAASGQQEASEHLFAVSGASLVRVDPRGSTHPAVAFENDSVGPFRSISVSHDSLLLGGQRGVLEIARDDLTLRNTYQAEVSSDFGFNTAARAGDVVLATHVEAGLLSWKSASEEPATLFRSFTPVEGELQSNAGASVAFSNASLRSGGGVKGPRFITLLQDNTAVFAVGSRLHLLHEQSVRDLDASDDVDVIAILSLTDHLLVVRKDGRCQTVDRDSKEIAQSASLRRELRAATIIPWMGAQRLIVADASGAVDCVGLEDSGVVRFHSPLLDFRMLSACSDRVAAVASDRQRIAIWSLTSTRQPIREVHIAALTRHRIAAIAFA